MCTVGNLWISEAFLSKLIKFPCSLAFLNMKYNCAVLFWDKYIGYLFMLPNIFSHRPPLWKPVRNDYQKQSEMDALLALFIWWIEFSNLLPAVLQTCLKVWVFFALIMKCRFLLTAMTDGTDCYCGGSFANNAILAESQCATPCEGLFWILPFMDKSISKRTFYHFVWISFLIVYVMNE